MMSESTEACGAMQSLLEELALGSLNESGRTLLLLHATGCVECRDVVAAMAEIDHQLERPAEPPTPARSRRRWSPLAAAASAAIAASAAASAVMLFGPGEDAVAVAVATEPQPRPPSHDAFAMGAGPVIATDHSIDLPVDVASRVAFPARASFLVDAYSVRAFTARPALTAFSFSDEPELLITPPLDLRSQITRVLELVLMPKCSAFEERFKATFDLR